MNSSGLYGNKRDQTFISKQLNKLNETWLSRRNRNSFAYLNQNYQKNPQDVHKNSFNPHDHSLNQQSNQVSCVNDKNMSLSVNITQTSNEKNFSAMKVGRLCNEDRNNFQTNKGSSNFLSQSNNPLFNQKGNQQTGFQNNPSFQYNSSRQSNNYKQSNLTVPQKQNNGSTSSMIKNVNHSNIFPLETNNTTQNHQVNVFQRYNLSDEMKSQIDNLIYFQVPILTQMILNAQKEQEQSRIQSEQSCQKFRNHKKQYFRRNLYERTFPHEEPEKKVIQIIIKDECQKPKNKKKKFFSSKIRAQNNDELDEQRPPKNDNFNKTIKRKIKYLINLMWTEEDTIIQTFEDTIEFSFQKSEERIYERCIKNHLLSNDKIEETDQIQILFVKPRKVYYLEGNLYRKKINLPQGYQYLPTKFQGFEIQNLSIFNEHGNLRWPGKTNIQKVDFSQIQIKEFEVYCEVPVLKKEAILELQKFPKNIQRQIQNGKNPHEIKELLGKFCEKRGSEFIKFDGLKWSMKVDFSK